MLCVCVMEVDGTCDVDLVEDAVGVWLQVTGVIVCVDVRNWLTVCDSVSALVGVTECCTTSRCRRCRCSLGSRRRHSETYRNRKHNASPLIDSDECEYAAKGRADQRTRSERKRACGRDAECIDGACDNIAEGRRPPVARVSTACASFRDK